MQILSSFQGKLSTGGRCTTAWAMVNQLFDKFFWKTGLLFSPFQQLSLKLIDNCPSGSVPFPCRDISLVYPYPDFRNLCRLIIFYLLSKKTLSGSLSSSDILDPFFSVTPIVVLSLIFIPLNFFEISPSVTSFLVLAFPLTSMSPSSEPFYKDLELQESARSKKIILIICKYWCENNQGSFTYYSINIKLAQTNKFYWFYF